MGYWNHRVCKETHDGSIISYEIREVYYNEDDSIWGVTTDDISVYADIVFEDFTEEEVLNQLKEVIDCFKKALEKPVIDLDTIVYTPQKKTKKDEDS